MNLNEELNRILFFAVPCTLAHVTRSIKIIEMLSDCHYDIYFATDKKYFSLLRGLPVTFVSLNLNNLKNFKERIEKGHSPFSEEELRNQIAEDLEIIDKVKPQIIFGDLRNSLSVSARLKKIIYININNSYWSSSISLSHPIPWSPLFNMLPMVVAKGIFDRCGYLIMKIRYYVAVYSINQVLKRVNIKFMDYRDFYIDGDITLFFDFPELVPLKKLRHNQKFLGPIIWSYKEDYPNWWETLDKTKKKILISLGSSGKADEHSKILQALKKFDVEIILISDDDQLKIENKEVHFARSLPLKEIMSSVDILICNGGSPTSYMGLHFGASILGIVSNNDQVLSMTHVEKYGAGILLRYQKWTEEDLSDAVIKLIFSRKYKAKVNRLQQFGKNFDQKQEIINFIRELWTKKLK